MSRLFSIASCFIALLFLINNNINNVSAFLPEYNTEFILEWSPSNNNNNNNDNNNKGEQQQTIRRIVEASKSDSKDVIFVRDYDGTQRSITPNNKFIWIQGDDRDRSNLNKIKLSSSLINNQCIQVFKNNDNGFNNGSSLGISDCTRPNGSSDIYYQLWAFTNAGIIYWAGNRFNNNEYCFGVENNNPGALLRFYRCTDNNDPYQHFNFIPVKNIPPPLSLINNDQFILQWSITKNDGVVSRYLFDSSSTPDNAILGNTINLSLFDGTAATINPGNKYSWIVTDSNNGIGKIKTTKNNLCYDLPYGDIFNGNAITMYDCNIGGQSNQQWKFRIGGNNANQRMIQFGSSPNQEKCLGVDNGASPLTIKLYDCDNADTKQQFDFFLTSTFY